MATTSAAPITIPQINHYYYVGEAMLRTIQQAVSFAVADNNAGTVIIPQEYAGTDTIASVTGGSSTVFIMDERNGQRSVYLWYHTSYVLEPTLVEGLGASQINHTIFVGAFSKYLTIQSAVDFAASVTSGYFTIIVQVNYIGSEDIETLTGGNATIYISDQRTPMWQNYSWNGTQFVPADFVPLGNVIVAGDISANVLAANDAEFGDCLVDNSPVRTFANTGDPSTGMTFPPAGIGVSTGTAWQPTSISPASLATWPAVGIPVSNGAAWGTSIDPATVPLLAVPNIFSAPQTAPFFLATGLVNPALTDGTALFSFATPVNAGQFHAQSTGPNLAELAFGGHSNAATARYLQYFNFAEPSGPGSAIGTFNVPIQAIAGASVSGFAPPVANTLRLTESSNISFIDAIGPNPTTQGTINLRTVSSDQSSLSNSLTLTGNIATLAGGVLRLGPRQPQANWAAGTPNINSDGISLVVNAGVGAGLFLNWDEGAGVMFGDGTGGQVANVDNTGHSNFRDVQFRDIVSAQTQDFNQLNVGGFYWIGANANAPPSSDTRNFTVLVISSAQATGFIIQFAWNFNVMGEMWTRQYSWGSWHPWYLLSVSPATQAILREDHGEPTTARTVRGGTAKTGKPESKKIRSGASATSRTGRTRKLR